MNLFFNFLCSSIRCTANMGIIANMEARSTALITRIAQAIQALPEVKLRFGDAWDLFGGPDAVLRLEVQGKPATLIIECKASGYPRDVREALWQLEEYKDVNEPSPVLMFVAPAISEGARSLLQEKGVSYGDSGGSVY